MKRELLELDCLITRVIDKAIKDYSSIGLGENYEDELSKLVSIMDLSRSKIIIDKLMNE